MALDPPRAPDWRRGQQRWSAAPVRGRAMRPISPGAWDTHAGAHTLGAGLVHCWPSSLPGMQHRAARRQQQQRPPFPLPPPLHLCNSIEHTGPAAGDCCAGLILVAPGLAACCGRRTPRCVRQAAAAAAPSCAFSRSPGPFAAQQLAHAPPCQSLQPQRCQASDGAPKIGTRAPAATTAGGGVGGRAESNENRAAGRSARRGAVRRARQPRRRRFGASAA